MDFYGTIGPACADVKLLQQMAEAGMTGIRMNLSHGPLAAHKDWLALLRKAGVKKLLIDLQGPELRIGRLPQPLSLTAGQTVRLGAQGIPCPSALMQGVQPGQELLLDDGKLLARVDAAEPDALVCTVVRGGVLPDFCGFAAPRPVSRCTRVRPALRCPLVPAVCRHPAAAPARAARPAPARQGRGFPARPDARSARRSGTAAAADGRCAVPAPAGR